MELKSYSDILKLHAQFAERFDKRVSELRKELRKSPEALIVAKRAAMKQVQERHKAIERTKKELVSRLDKQLGSLTQDIQQLEDEIKTLEGGLRRNPSTHKARTPGQAKEKKKRRTRAV